MRKKLSVDVTELHARLENFSECCLNTVAYKACSIVVTLVFLTVLNAKNSLMALFQSRCPSILKCHDDSHKPQL